MGNTIARWADRVHEEVESRPSVGPLRALLPRRTKIRLPEAKMRATWLFTRINVEESGVFPLLLNPTLQ